MSGMSVGITELTPFCFTCLLLQQASPSVFAPKRREGEAALFRPRSRTGTLFLLPHPTGKESHKANSLK